MLPNYDGWYELTPLFIAIALYLWTLLAVLPLLRGVRATRSKVK